MDEGKDTKQNSEKSREEKKKELWNSASKTSDIKGSP